ncbi:hypothetical protein CK203_108977 [Vitis vinifera]|uniref:Uncharacterized protein n=1 Tax=Vitis vinifera TaxID=29760 RepID=A0A438D3Y5_VITVI|nr:hypothetical protein CK203_108977 [Vitis vinifera]
MSSKKKTVSSTRVGDAREKATDKLDVKEFRDRFCIPNGVIVELLDDEEHVRSPALPPIGDGAAGLDEGRCKGTRCGPGCMGGVEASGEALLSKLLLSDSGRQGEALQDAAFCAESNGGRPGAPGVCRQHSPQEAAKRGSAWEHYTMKDLPIYQESKEADAEKRRALLDDQEKRKNERTLRKAPGQKRGAASPPKKVPAKKRKLVKNGKGVKEPTPPKNLLLRQLLTRRRVTFKEAAFGAQSEVRTHRAASDHQQEIEVSCTSAHDARPEGCEVEMATGTPAVPVMVPDEVGILLMTWLAPFASPFSYAELEDKLKQIPLGLTAIIPSAKMFEMVETLVSGLRGMANQHDLFTDLLRITDYMRTFASRLKDSENQLRLSLEEAESSLSTVREDNEALRADLAEAKSQEELTIARLYEAEDEMARLRGK